jgi:hypothetical protein
LEEGVNDGKQKETVEFTLDQKLNAAGDEWNPHLDHATR